MQTDFRNSKRSFYCLLAIANGGRSDEHLACVETEIAMTFCVVWSGMRRGESDGEGEGERKKERKEERKEEKERFKDTASRCIVGRSDGWPIRCVRQAIGLMAKWALKVATY